MPKQGKKALIVFNIMIYMVFACCYVLLCHREMATVKAEKEILANQALSHSQPSSKSFPRPRVIFNKPAYTLTIAILLISVAALLLNIKNITFYIRRYQVFHIYGPPVPILLRNLRI